MSNRHTKIKSRKSKTDTSTKQKKTPPIPKKPYLEEIPAGKPKKNRGKKFLKFLFYIAIIAVIAVTGILVWQNWDKIAPDGVAFTVTQLFAGNKKGDGFPVSITGSTVVSMGQTTQGLTVITDTSYMLYNNTGAELVRRQHGFANPVLKTCGKWALLYDQNNKSLRLDSHASTSMELRTNENIINASVNQNGEVAVVAFSSSGSYTCEIFIYDRKGKQIYHRFLSDIQATDAVVSPDGKNFAVSGFTGREGAMKSSVLFFDIKKQEPINRIDDENILFSRIAYFSSESKSNEYTALAIGDNALWVVDKELKIKERISYDDHALIGFSVSQSCATIVLRHYSNSDGGILLTVDNKGNVVKNQEFEGAFHCIAPKQEGAYLLTSLYLYDITSDNNIDKMQVSRDGKYVSALGEKAIVSGLTELKEYSFKSEEEQVK